MPAAGAVRRALGAELRGRGVPGPADGGGGGGRATQAAARDAQRLFATPTFRVYSGDDVIGVELAGALKNVIAIAAGILEGLGLGHNPRAALITRGLAEITRLGVALGADPLTFAGLAGMGDLVLTTTGSLSRNRALGRGAGAGRDARATTARRTAAWPKGANTSRAGAALGRAHGRRAADHPEGLRSPVRAGSRPRDAVAELMERELKSEQWR